PRMLRRVPAAALAALSLALLGAGCAGQWKYGGRSYGLPEEALRAQQADLDREVAQVEPVLRERKLPGRCLASLPTEPALRRALFEADADLTAEQFYAASLQRNEAAALVSGLGRAEVFDGVDVVESELPGAQLFDDAGWLLVWSADARRAPAWQVVCGKTGAVADVAFTREDASSSERCDRFAAAVAKAGDAARRSPAAGPWVRRAWGRFTSGDLVFYAPKGRDGRPVPSYGGLGLTVETVDLPAGMAGAEAVAQTLRLIAQPDPHAAARKVLLEAPSPDGRGKLAFIEREDGRISAAHVFASPRTIVIASAVGEPAALYRRDVPVSAPLPERLCLAARAFLANVDAR
ncbi:MAG TPA: hypothetical protein VHF22_14755, partial [Planctomycetota bacterium]|nr:hypothetical protein [Planctomycetota bacterium]